MRASRSAGEWENAFRVTEGYGRKRGGECDRKRGRKRGREYDRKRGRECDRKRGRERDQLKPWVPAPACETASACETALAAAQFTTPDHVCAQLARTGATLADADTRALLPHARVPAAEAVRASVLTRTRGEELGGRRPRPAVGIGAVALLGVHARVTHGNRPRQCTS